MKCKLISALLLLCYSGLAVASENTDPIDKFVNESGLIVRKGLSNKNFAKDPASISWISPDDGESSTATDIGLAFRLIESSNDINSPWILLPKIEYHKNTLTDKKQDTFKAGIIFSRYFNAEEALTHCIETSAEYKNDRKQVGQGAAISISYTPTYAPLHLGYTGSGPFQYMFTPWVAIQAEKADGIKENDSNGSVSRIKASMQLAIYPLHDFFNKNFEVILSYQNWFNISRSGTFDSYDHNQHLFNSTLNIYFDNKQRFGVGIDYSSGENPEEGMAHENTISSALKVKLGK